MANSQFTTSALVPGPGHEIWLTSSFMQNLRHNYPDINPLTLIPYDSPAFLAHSILAAQYAYEANTATSIEELGDIQRRVINTIFYSELGISPEIEALYTAISKCCVLRMEKKREEAEYSEQLMYRIFRKNPSKFIPGAIILKRKKIKGSVPDFFLEVDGIFCIAEFKIQPFKQRHLFQLQEYMHVYGASKGYAVAFDLACMLPLGVSFIKFPSRAMKE